MVLYLLYNRSDRWLIEDMDNTYPLQVPRVTPRESILVGAAGLEEDHELTVIVGRPPAKDDVVRIRNVRAPICDEVAVHLMVVGLLTATNLAKDSSRMQMVGMK
jgi:hypothetical protein